MIKENGGLKRWIKFLAQTGTTKELMNEFREDTLGFLYHQEDRTGYTVKTISYLIDEMQSIVPCETNEEMINKLSKDGKRRYNTIKNQLLYLLENDFEEEE